LNKITDSLFSLIKPRRNKRLGFQDTKAGLPREYTDGTGNNLLSGNGYPIARRFIPCPKLTSFSQNDWRKPGSFLYLKSVPLNHPLPLIPEFL